MTIMIVEDDAVSLALLEKSLRPKEPSLITTRSGNAAWSLFNEHRPRIVISDWMLPELSGLDLCRRIRASDQTTYTYVIIMTAKDKREDVLAAFEAGADDYVAKPFDVRELHARLNTGRRILELEDNHQAMQHTLINSRNKIRTVFDALPEEIISVDRDMKIVSMNKAALDTRQGSFDVHIDQPCCSISEETPSMSCGQAMEHLIKDAFKMQTQQFLLDRFEDEKGNEVIKERIALPVMDEMGRISTVTVVSRDITDAHQHNEEINDLNRKLKKISSELIKKNRTLENTLENLERTQMQMLQSEKMASIGQLAAGVAHEINNPTGFVSSNLKTLGDYQQDLNRVIGDYQQLKTTLKQLPEDRQLSEIADPLAQVEATEEEVDIAYIREDVDELIADCREGTERIKKIVNDLKHFAHPGEDKMKETDIITGIESTLNVVYNELKYKASIVKELGDVPIIDAYPQQLNQVFMNILVNAAQAIKKSGEIRIVTETVDDMAEIRISDTGCGIPEENLNKIFDPFFTTKDVGKGTGLGMNIAYNIISKHNGQIQVESTLGKGTTFIIRLPAHTPSESTGSGPVEKAVSA